MMQPTDEGVASPAGPVKEFLGEPFRLASITEVPPPDGYAGTWQQYVIMQGSNTITGHRAGTREEVSVALESLVIHLNERFERRQVKPERTSVRRPRGHASLTDRPAG